MKKYVLAAILAAGFSVVKAQQVTAFIEPKALTFDALHQKMLFHTDSIAARPPLVKPINKDVQVVEPNELLVYSGMPVKKIESLPSKTLVVASGKGITYTMPIKKVRIINPDSVDVRVNP